MTTKPLNELYGKGLERPLRLTSAGRLATSEGERRLWESVQEIMETPRGSRPMNPTFGVPSLVYESFSDVRAVAWAIGTAIEANEPRAQDIVISIDRVSPADGTIWLDVAITPVGTSTPTNKIFPVYRQQE